MLLAAFGVSATLFALWLYMTIYLQQVLGLSAIEAALVYVPGIVLNFAVAESMAQVGQRVSPRVLLPAGLALVGAGLALMTLTEAGSSWTAFLLVAMVGMDILNPIIGMVALSSVPPEQSGLAAGVNDMFRQAGIAVGVAALGALVPERAAFGGAATEYVAGFHDALWIGADASRRRQAPPPAQFRPSGRARRRPAAAPSPAPRGRTSRSRARCGAPAPRGGRPARASPAASRPTRP